jgi:hypothetical protein
VGAPSAGCFIGAGTHAGKIAYVENGALMAAPIGGAAATIAAIPCSTCTVRGVECSPTTPQVTVHTTTGGEIYLVNTDSGAVETVLTDALAGTCAAWARDGQALVLARAASTNVTAGLWVYRGAGTSSAAYEGRIATAPANAQWPAWCGNKIVYESAGDLYLILNR